EAMVKLERRNPLPFTARNSRQRGRLSLRTEKGYCSPVAILRSISGFESWVQWLAALLDRYAERLVPLPPAWSLSHFDFTLLQNVQGAGSAARERNGVKSFVR